MAKLPKLSKGGRKPKVIHGGKPPASGEKKIKLRSTATNKELNKWPPKGKKSSR